MKHLKLNSLQYCGAAENTESYCLLSQQARVMLSCHKSKSKSQKTHISNPLYQHQMFDMLGEEKIKSDKERERKRDSVTPLDKNVHGFKHALLICRTPEQTTQHKLTSV